MNIRHLSFALVAGLLLTSCNKDNPGNNDNPGGGDEPQKNTPVVILQQDFTKGLGPFTVQDKDKGGFGSAIWKYESANAKYGAQATASKGSGSNFKAESWLVSPEIDLTNYTDAYLCFRHAFAYVNSGVPKDYFGIKVSTDGGNTWVDMSVPQWLVAHSYFELAQSGNVPLGGFKGRKIKFAFVYKSTADVAPTWEITDLVVSYEKQTILPDDEGDKYKSVPKWMEMPQVNNTSAWHAHTSILRFDRVRNYSFSYNEPYMVSDWVAYPLYNEISRHNKSYKVTRYDNVVSSNKAWQPDPFVQTTSNVQSGSLYEWSDKGYSRGHQLPSGDRLGGAMVNMQTFYTSNVTPQRSDFNSGIWEKLEDAVRDWSASSDTMYVVTGCIADNTCETVKDHDGNAVAVPKAYYKALLRLKGGNYIAAGFYLKHENTTKEYKEFALSVKELEQKTGMTFFVNLPSDKAAAIKAEDPTTNHFWGLK